jgi:hypothetical protein
MKKNTNRQIVRVPEKNQRKHERGAASIVVVALLLLVMAIVVAFANRSIIFEQKTSANQYRATLAFEAAEAGLAWAQAMLNESKYITTDCAATTTATSNERFKDRYLNILEDTTIGFTYVNPATPYKSIAACVYNQAGGTMNCSCPRWTNPHPNPPTHILSALSPSIPTTGSGYNLRFDIEFESNTRTGTVDIISKGCTLTTGTPATCTGGDASAAVRATLGQISGLATPPSSPLTARGNVSIGNAALGVSNPDPNTNGVTINAGGTIDAANAIITTVPGTPPKATLVGNDSSLRDKTEDGLFASFFGMSKDAYKSLSYILPCTSCTDTDLITAYNAGQRQIWVPGSMTINANSTIGTSTDPFVMVVDGAIDISGGPQISAVIYSTAATWNSTGGGSALLRGAIISEGDYTGNGTPNYYYDPEVMRRIRSSAKSFAQAPGSWRDF